MKRLVIPATVAALAAIGGDRVVRNRFQRPYEAPKAREDWRGAARLPAPDGFVVEVSAVERWGVWRALIRMDDGSSFEIYATDYDRAVALANRFVSRVVEHRMGEALAQVALPIDPNPHLAGAV